MATAAGVAAGAAILSAGVSVKSSVDQRRAQDEARRAERKRAALEERRAAIQNARERRKLSAEARIQAEQVRARAAAASGVDSTSTSNTIGAIGSQTAGAIGFQQTLSNLSTQQIRLGQQANDARADAAKAQALGALPGQLGVGFGDIIGNFDGFSNSLKSVGNKFRGQ